MRLEYSILLERLEANAVKFPEFGEEMSPPPSPVFDVADKPKGATKKQKKTTSVPIKNRIRDPNLPKRPTNAYLIFCEIEKERIRQESGENNLAMFQDLGKSLTEKWKSLDEEAKKPYHKLYDEDKERYKNEMEAYSKRQPSDVKTEPVDDSTVTTPSLNTAGDIEAETENGDLDQADEDNDNDNDTDDNDTNVNDEDEEDDDEEDDKMDINKSLNVEPQSELHSEFPSELASEPASEPASESPFDHEIKEE